METNNIRHTVIVPSYNTLEHLKNTVNSLLLYGSNIDIILIDDASTDGTADWFKTLKGQDIRTIISPIRKGHTYWYDEGMRMSKTDIVSILHSDMIIGPCYFENMLAHLKPGRVVCATRIEPPIHPAGKEKIVKDFGDEANTFNWDKFKSFCNEERMLKFGETTKGIFAPWMLYKEDHLSIGGHDQGFAPYGYEDSDIFNRWILAGYEMLQARDSLCYHMTCRGHRWNAGVGIENSDYQETMANGRKHFLKKWGHWIKNDEYQYPIISPVYKKKLIIHNDNENLNQLYDWFNDGEDIIIEIDGNTFTQQDFEYISNLNDIVQDSGEIGTFELGNIKVTINNIKDYSKDLIFL
jgi:glycosyltransferase involved in cell wall biosynthesis